MRYEKDIAEFVSDYLADGRAEDRDIAVAFLESEPGTQGMSDQEFTKEVDELTPQLSYYTNS